MFKKTTPIRISEDLVSQIQNAILKGKLKPGDKLPSQRELGEMFQVSRASLREALRVLEHQGLIETKLGVNGGAVIKDPGTGHITEELNLLIRFQKVSLDHLTEFRRVVEGDVAALAAERADSKDNERLKQLLKEAKSYLSSGTDNWEGFIKKDIDLHIAIAEISDNPVFKAVLQMVHENILGYYENFSLKEHRILMENYEQMEQIVKAIAAKNPEEARKISLCHVQKFHDYMKQKK